MTKTRWIVFAVITALVLGGLVVLAQRDKVSVDDVNPDVVIKDGDYPNSNYPDHVYGKADSKVVLIEYGDFQCPGCQSVNPAVVDVRNEYKDHIAFVYRHLPLTNIHPNALASAAAAEAAGKQGKYWEMHEKLFETQDSWSNATAEQRQTFFDGYARELGLDLEKFKADMISDEVTRRINRDRALAAKIGADSTPTFVLNGEKLTSDITEDLGQSGGKKLRELLDKKIKEAGGTPPTDQQKTE